MKRFVAMVTALAMAVLCVPVFAAANDADDMQNVLIKVKEHISIPEELGEFSGSVYESDGEKNYNFEWSSSDYEKSLSVSSDGMGRIESYYNYNGQMRSDKKLPKFSKAEIIEFAEKFLMETVPQAFERDGLFVDSYSVGNGLRCNVGFVRKKDGVRVLGNSADVTVYAGENELCVRSMNIDYDYDAVFDEKKTEISDYAEKYKDVFPTELVYADEYLPQAKGDESPYTPRLIWRIKDGSAGYMDMETGEKIVEDGEERLYKESTEDSAANDVMSSGGGGSLSFREITELENVRGLLSEEEVADKIKALPYISIDDGLNGTVTLYKRNGKYFYRLSYYGDGEYVNASADAETGELLNFSAKSENTKEELSQDRILEAEKKLSEFLKATSSKFSKTQKEETTATKNKVSTFFVRVENGVKYVDNGLNATFDTKSGKIISYNSDFTEGSLEDPENAISKASAYDKILEHGEILPVYVKSGGVYKKAAVLTAGGAEIDAVTGEYLGNDDEEKYIYADLDGHWAQEAAEKLSEIGIGISGGELLPDEKMTQKEFLRIASSAIIADYYGRISEEELYEQLTRDGVLKDGDVAPDSQITREDAFVFIIRMAGFERIAELSGIYSLDFGDATLLSNGKIGYAAILTGLGVLSGDGANLRPSDITTRAEAVVMIYKYLLTL